MDEYTEKRNKKEFAPKKVRREYDDILETKNKKNNSRMLKDKKQNMSQEELWEEWEELEDRYKS